MIPPDPPQRLIPMARRAEELGYDLPACADHVFFHTAVTNAFIALAGAADATHQIRLLSAVTLLPTYRAAVVFSPACAPDDFQRSAETFAREVIPSLTD